MGYPVYPGSTSALSDKGGKWEDCDIVLERQSWIPVRGNSLWGGNTMDQWERGFK